MPFTDPWTESEPTDNTYVREIDDWIRRIARAVRERMSVEHYAFQDETGKTNVGKHKPGSAKILAGVAGGKPQPDPDAPGTIYHETDSHRIVRDTGSGWVILDHAASHSSDGDDPITPEMIGAETPDGANQKVQAVATELDSHKNATSVHSATTEAAANRIPIRDAGGQFKVGKPTDSAHVARLAEVNDLSASIDGVAADLSDHEAATQAHAATSDATPGRIVLRDAQGSAKFSSIEIVLAGSGIIFKTPDGQHRWMLSVNNNGDLVTTEV